MIPESDENRKAMNKAQRILSARAHSVAELRKKLRSGKFSSRVIKHVLDECIRLGFLNDPEFARSYRDELRDRRYGNYRIKNCLRKKGIDGPLIEEVLSESDVETEKENAKKAAAAKLRLLKNEADPRKKREKLIRHLMSRGFSSETIFRALDEYDINE